MLGDYDDNTARAGFMVTGHHTSGAGWWSDGIGTLRSEGGGGTPEQVIVSAPQPGDQAVATLQGGGRRGHRIDAEGAAGGHLIPFDTAQITSAENRSHPRAGDPAPTLNGTGAMCTPPVPFRVGADEPRSPLPLPARVSHAITSREGKGADSDATSGFVVAPAVAATLTSGAHSDRSNAPGRHDEDQFNLVAIPIALRGRDGGSQIEVGVSGDPAFAIRTAGGGSSYPMVAHALTSAGADASEDGTGRGTPLVPYARPVPSSLAVAGDFSAGEDVAQTIRGANGQPGCVTSGLAVRRLTPLECERLQGFPDDWTRWKVAGGGLAEQSDSARYRQIGNAVTTTVVEWIAARLVAADLARAREAGAA